MFRQKEIWIWCSGRDGSRTENTVFKATNQRELNQGVSGGEISGWHRQMTKWTEKPSILKVKQVLLWPQVPFKKKGWTQLPGERPEATRASSAGTWNCLLLLFRAPGGPGSAHQSAVACVCVSVFTRVCELFESAWLKHTAEVKKLLKNELIMNRNKEKTAAS